MEYNLEQQNILIPSSLPWASLHEGDAEWSLVGLGGSESLLRTAAFQHQTVQ